MYPEKTFQLNLPEISPFPASHPPTIDLCFLQRITGTADTARPSSFLLPHLDFLYTSSRAARLSSCGASEGTNTASRTGRTRRKKNESPVRVPKDGSLFASRSGFSSKLTLVRQWHRELTWRTDSTGRT